MRFKAGRFRLIHSVVAVVALVASVLLVGGEAQAGHTLPKDDGGDCWRSSTPLWCRTSWSTAPYHQIRLRMVRQFTNLEPTWTDQLATACNNWHNFVPSGNYGDIQCHHSAIPYDSLVYWKWANPALPSDVGARTYNCTSSGNCSASASQSRNVWYSEVHMNRSAMRSLSAAKRVNVFAHEMGHTLGLWHHDGLPLMNSTVTTVSGPTSTDYGRKPPCDGPYSSYGVRCVFNFTN